MPFAKCFPLRNLGEGGKAAEPDIVDPTPGLGDGGKQTIAALGFHRRFCAGLMNDALHGDETWRRPGKRDCDR